MTNTTTTPSRQEMIQAIYEKIARKDLSFGCKMKSQSYNGVLISIEGGDNAKIMDVDYYNSISFEDINDFEIIGHPVMIGDVVDWVEKNIKSPIKTETKMETLSDGITIPVTTAKIVSWNETTEGMQMNTMRFAYKLWKEIGKPIEEQSDECIEFVYHLISE